MTTETQVAPAAETQNTAADPTETLDVVDPDSTGSEAQTGDESETKPEKTAEQKELDRLRRLVTKRDRTQGKMYQELQATQQELARLRHAGAAETPTEPTEAATVEAKAHALAQQIAQQKDFARSVEGVLKAGREMPDFDAACNALDRELPFYERTGRPTPFLAAVLEFDHPEQLLHHLGTNAELTDELADLTPTRLARRLDAIEREMKDKAKPKTSSAPKPLEPVKGQGSAKDPSAMSDAEFAAWRRRQIAQRR